MLKGDFHNYNYLDFRCWNAPNNCSTREESRINLENYDGLNFFTDSITGVLNLVPINYSSWLIIVQYPNQSFKD